MKKHLLRIFTFVFAIFTVFAYVPFGIVESNAATAASALLNISDTDVRVGDNFQVTLNVTSSEVMAYFMYEITYDADKLQFIPTQGQDAANGTIKEMIDPGQNTNKIERVFNFSAKAVGTCEIKVSDVNNISLSTVKPIETEKGKLSIKISDFQKSSNCNLKSMEPSIGTMVPAFSKDVLNYTVTVPPLTKVCYINYSKEDSTADVKYTGNEYLTVGEKVRKFTVTAADGTEKVYTITIIRPEDPDPTVDPSVTPDISPTIEPSPTIPDIPEESYFGIAVVGEDEYKIYDIKSLISQQFPDEKIKNSTNFLFGTYIVNGLRCYSVGSNTQYAVYAQKNNEEKAIYIFDSADKIVLKFRGTYEQFVKSFDIIEGTFETPNSSEVEPEISATPSQSSSTPSREPGYNNDNSAIIVSVVFAAVIVILTLAVIVIVNISKKN